jgi:hypothetical protein
VDLVQLDALGPASAYRSRTRAFIRDVRGEAVAELSMAPSVFVSRAMSVMRRSRPLPPPARDAALRAAADLFCSGVVAGLRPAEYHQLVSEVAGLGRETVRRSATAVADSCRHAVAAAEYARPRGAVPEGARVGEGGARWVRRGRLLGVHAAGNHPAVHGHWLEALALGYSVAVRPSRREPFTAHRLVSALREAGFGTDQVALLPQARVELPFPCVWVCPWTPRDGISPLRDTLVLTVMTANDQLVEELLAEPTIRNVYVGRVPTYWTAPGVPHDDYLAAFLMESKGFVRFSDQPSRTGSVPSQPTELT